MSSVYSIESRPYYNSKDTCYTRIFTIDRSPTQPFLNIVKSIVMPKLSPFETNHGCCLAQRCALAIYNPTSPTQLLQPGEEAILFSYLIQNGYKIDTSLTKLMQDSTAINNSRLLCMISK